MELWCGITFFTCVATYYTEASQGYTTINPTPTRSFKSQNEEVPMFRSLLLTEDGKVAYASAKESIYKLIVSGEVFLSAVTNVTNKEEGAQLPNLEDRYAL